jgi:hypothetical protein
VLETALIAVQERLYGGDPEGATMLMDDVEAALEAGGLLTRPSLQARQAILDLVAAEDRAVLRADPDAYRDPLDPAFAQSLGGDLEVDLQVPFTAYRQQVVRLDLAQDGLSAEGVVLLHVELADGDSTRNGRLFALSFVKATDGWLVTGREPAEPDLSLALSTSKGSSCCVLHIPHPAMQYAMVW